MAWHHAAERQVEALRLALAEALHGRRRGRAFAGQNAQGPQSASGPEVAKRVVALTLKAPPGETTHWTGAMMAEAAGISVSAVQRIWRAHGLRPHKVEQFKLSNDPKFVDKLRDVVAGALPIAITIVPRAMRKNGC